MLSPTNSPDELRRLKHDLSSPITVIYCLVQDLIQQYSQQENTANQSKTQTLTSLNLLLQAATDITNQLSWRHDPATFRGKENILLEKFLRQFAIQGNRPYPIDVQVYTTDLKKLAIYGDPQQLKLALTHLVNNACEAYHLARPCRQVKIYAHPFQTGILIMVQDHGRGMNFWQKLIVTLKNISFKKIKSGLGLWEAKRIIAAEFGGLIKIFSSPNQGTSLCVYLPT